MKARKSGTLHVWLEALVACVTGCVAILTAVWPAWIEGIFGVDPDRRSGLLEWAVVIVCVALTLVFGILARRQWLRAASAPSS